MVKILVCCCFGALIYLPLKLGVQQTAQTTWLHSNWSKLPTKWSYCTALQVIVKCIACCGEVHDFIIKKLHRSDMCVCVCVCVYIHIVSGQLSVSAFQFHDKMALFWINIKSKVQNLIHFSISHSHSSLLIPSFTLSLSQVSPTLSLSQV